jgi:hypothetical protein
MRTPGLLCSIILGWPPAGRYKETALEHFLEVYSQNIDDLDVAE